MRTRPGVVFCSLNGGGESILGTSGTSIFGGGGGGGGGGKIDGGGGGGI
ncbi:hypothetical protein [Afipia sp. Root123D2]|nr:hypothetical protein [Afipia sp. Root123D2]